MSSTEDKPIANRSCGGHLVWRPSSVCRNIKALFNFEPPATEDEIHAASLQYVRKMTGFNKPSKTNETAFYSAVEDIARISGRLLASLETTASPKDREEEATKARSRSALRFGG
jgi:hypothetical protein